MKDGDLPDEGALVELSGLPPGDPRRIEAERDPRVRAWLAQFDAFVAGEALSAGDATRAADAGRRAIEALGPRPSAARWRGLAVAAAALIVVAVGALVAVRRGADSGDALRTLPRSGEPVLATLPPLPATGGAIELRWHAMPTADRYTIELLDGLSAVARFETVDTAFTVPDSAWGSAERRAQLLWRIVASRAGDPLGVSAPRPLAP